MDIKELMFTKMQKFVYEEILFGFTLLCNDNEINKNILT